MSKKNKKTIAGVIIFTIALGIFIGYPNIQEYRYRKSVEAMIDNQEFEKVYNQLIEKEIPEYDWQYISLMIAEFELGHSIHSKVQELIYHREISLLQSLVDNLGVRLGTWLGLTLLPVEGLVFDNEIKYYLATQEILGIAPHNLAEYGKALEKAMEFRVDTDPVDHIYIRYLLHKGDFQKALDLYSEIPEELSSDALSMFSVYFLNGNIYNWEKGYDVPSGGLHLYESDTIKENIAGLESLKMPEDVISHIMWTAASYSRSPYYDYALDLIEETPYFTENMYYQFYTLVYQLGTNDTSVAEAAFDELKARAEFQRVKGYHDIVKIYEDFRKVTKINKVSNAGILYYTEEIDDELINKGHNIYGGSQIEGAFPKPVRFLEDSPGKSNFLAEVLNESESKTEHVILNNKFELVHSFTDLEDVFRSTWVDDTNLVIVAISVISSSYPSPNQVFNTETRGMSDFVGEVTTPTIEYKGNFEVYSINEDTYTAFDYIEIMGEARYREYTHYVVRDINTNEVLYKLDLEQIPGGLYYFIGDCDKYIYYQEVVGPFIVVGAIDKETRTTSRLPLYTTEFNYELFSHMLGN